MKKEGKKIVIPRLEPRRAPAPAERVIPNPKKEKSRRACREKIPPAEVNETKD